MRWSWVALFLILALLLMQSGDRAPRVVPVQPESVGLVASLEHVAADLVRQSPETVTTRGIAAQLGVRNDALDGVALDATGESYAPLERALAQISGADLSALSSRERWAVASFGEWLRDVLEGRQFQTYVCPVSTYLTSIPQHIAWFMEHVHPLETRTDAEDFLSRLSQVPDRLEDLVARLAMVETAGAMAPRDLLLRAAGEIEALGSDPVEATALYRRLAAAVERIPDVDEDARCELLSLATARLRDDVFPAFIQLAATVREFAARASDEIGVWRLSDGDAYYRHLLRVHTSTEMTAEEILDLGRREVSRLQGEIRAAAARLDYDPGVTLPALFARLREDSGVASGEAIVDACKDFIAAAADLVRDAFIDLPDALPAVKPGGRVAYYAEGTDDGSRPGVFFVPLDQGRSIYSLRSLVYHETIPGHFLQATIARRAELPEFARSVAFTGYTEGWALYAERLAWELGAYSDDPHGDLGRLQEELLRAARLVVDPGIHAMHWTRDQALDYLTQETGLDEATARDEIDRYVVAPGQATAYGVGLHKFLELRERARDALGPAFDLAQFHQAILSCGSAPFSVLEEVVDGYVTSRQLESISSLP